MWKSILFLLKQILQTNQRTEAKLDALLRRQLNQTAPIQPMSYAGQVDPLSQRSIKWQAVTLEDGTSVTVRIPDDLPLTTELPATVAPIQSKEI